VGLQKAWFVAGYAACGLVDADGRARQLAETACERRMDATMTASTADGEGPATLGGGLWRKEAESSGAVTSILQGLLTAYFAEAQRVTSTDKRSPMA
jgi:hypothetical protein